MIFKQKKITLKDGRVCILKTPNKEDAHQMIEYLKQSSRDTDFMLRYPEEVTFTIEKEQTLLCDLANSSDSMMIAAFIDGVLAGNCSFAAIGPKLKVKHRCQMGIAIKKEYWCAGIGRILLEEAINQARECGFEQMELEVVSRNTRAIRLYEKVGFEVYGIRKNAMKLKDGTYYSELLMMKRL
jgi:ribosomal protein S18 acetylase RimI-like enzyme